MLHTYMDLLHTGVIYTVVYSMLHTGLIYLFVYSVSKLLHLLKGLGIGFCFIFFCSSTNLYSYAKSRT